MAREVTRPVVPAPQPGPEPDTGPPVTVQHQGLRHVPDGTTVWVPHPEHGTLVYQSGQLLPDHVREALAAGASLVPGPQPGVLVLEKAGKR